MRRHEQLSLDRPWIDHSHADELAKISEILDRHPDIAELVEQDLVRGVRHPERGARGMSGDQVIRVLVLKQMNGFSYSELAFHVADSVSYRTFCRFGALGSTPSRSTLAENLKKVRPETLERIQRILVRDAAERGVERGRKVRIDATVVETNVHAPTDSSLLWDGVRVLTRLLKRADEDFGFRLWSDHRLRAKRRMLAVQYTGSTRKRTAAYRDLLKVSHKAVGYSRGAVSHLRRQHLADPGAQKLADQLTHYVGLVLRVIDQTERRVIGGQRVPSSEKLVSLFEPHTDIIVKDRRDTHYGHKVFVTGGASGMILDCKIEKGNPADSTLALPMLERQVEIYRRLRDFRAGIEGLISFLKRAFGLRRCTWRGEQSFASYVQASVLTANLLTLARHLLA